MTGLMRALWRLAGRYGFGGSDPRRQEQTLRTVQGAALAEARARRLEMEARLMAPHGRPPRREA